MKAYKDFIISPIGYRYNNSKKVGDKNLILNTEIFNHQYVNRKAKVISTPLLFNSPVKVGDEIIVHHNIFRRWHDVKGREKNSRSYWKEDKYIISEDQIYLYKQNKKWKAMPGYSFVKPLKSTSKFNTKKEKPLVGIVKYSDGTFNNFYTKELVGFTPNSEYEFIVDGQRLYRVMNKFITIKYEYKGNEEEYNPSWAQSS
jgi:hypothetical protein